MIHKTVAPSDWEFSATLSVPLVPAASTFIPIAAAIAFTHLAALFLVSAGTPQALAVRHASTALRAIATAVALADLATLLFVDAGAVQALAIAPRTYCTCFSTSSLFRVGDVTDAASMPVVRSHSLGSTAPGGPGSET